MNANLKKFNLSRPFVGKITGFVLGLGLAASAQAQGPAWWYERGVISTNQSTNDYALVNLGQLKWVATNAYAEMETYFGAGTNLAVLIASFADTNNYYLANVGQVKYVAKPFYDRLYELNLTNTFPSNMPGYYPWGNGQTTNDYTLANVGQVKYAFSFDSAVDTDGDGLPDWQEAELDTNPYNSDTDGDGYDDGMEVEWGTDPNSTSSFPHAAISGTLTYTGAQTGTIWVVASTNSGGDGTVQQVSQPGGYTVANVPVLKSYWIRAWRDANGNGSNDYWEAQGTVAASPLYLTGDVANVNITLTESDSDNDGLPDWWEIVHGLDPFDPNDAEPELANLREQARQHIIRHSLMAYGSAPAFTNTPGSTADLNDLKNALNALSGKFYKVVQ